MTSSPTKSLVVFATLLLVIAMGGFSYELYAIESEKQASVDLETTMQSERASSATLGSLRAIQTDHAEEINKIDSIIITTANPVPFLGLLENTGKRLGLKLKVSSVTVEEGKGSKGDKLNISMEMEGSWQQMLAFVHAIESLPYHVVVNNLNITTDVGTGATPAAKQTWSGNATLVLDTQ